MLRNTTLCTDRYLIRNDYSNDMNYSDDDDNGNPWCGSECNGNK